MKPFHWILAILLLILLGSSLFLNWWDRNALRFCSRTTTAYLKDIYKLPKKGFTFVYVYKVDSVVFEKHEWITNGDIVEQYSVGDSLRIEYACEDNDISKVKSNN